MYAHLLAALILIPSGYSSLVRGNEALHRGRIGPGKAAVLSLCGGVMILAAAGLLLGGAFLGVLALIALALAGWLRRPERWRTGRGGFASSLVSLGARITAVAALLWLGTR